ncbi:MAG: hypothetical protein AAF800_08455 [Planctomycetota bacterium]
MYETAAYNPTGVLLRLTNLLVIVGCVYGLFAIGRNVFNHFDVINVWYLLYVMPILALLAIGFFYFVGLKNPTHTHLSLLVAAGFLAVVGVALPMAGSLTYFVFVPEVAAALNGLLFWLGFVIALIAAITVDWRLGKAAGLRDADEMWWNEKRIRGFCVFLAWWVFLGVLSWSGAAIDNSKIFNTNIDGGPSVLLFLGLIAFCGAIGGLLPHLLMSLTGITPGPPIPRRRRRGFHLWRGTEPVPPSEWPPKVQL